MGPVGAAAAGFVAFGFAAGRFDRTEEITAGGALGRRVTVGSELVLGRAVSGDGRLSEDPELSRRHARLARDAAGQLTIEDLGSANGTFMITIVGITRTWSMPIKSISCSRD